MSHEIDMSNGQANVAYLGSRNDVWHKLGQEMKEGESIESWATNAGLNWTALQVPAVADLSGPQFDHLRKEREGTGWNSLVGVPDKLFTVRSDTGRVLGVGSDGRKEHQPLDILNWFDRYIKVDSRFKLDAAGSLRGGAVIWATALFNGTHEIAGEAHVARLLMSTAFDGTSATWNRMTETRVICKNTLQMASMDKEAQVRTTHRSRFNPEAVSRELARLASSVAKYKAVGDALAQHEMTAQEVSEFFKTLLEIPFDAKRDDISARKSNQFADLSRAFTTSARERNTERVDAWTALQAVTRYVDHDRSTKGENETEGRFASSQFGSGALLKSNAMGLLMPRIKDKVLIAA